MKNENKCNNAWPFDIKQHPAKGPRPRSFVWDTTTLYTDKKSHELYIGVMLNHRHRLWYNM